jgi:hypothetical protein
MQCVCVCRLLYSKTANKSKVGAEHVTRKTQINKLLYPTHAFLFFSTKDEWKKLRKKVVICLLVYHVACLLIFGSLVLICHFHQVLHPHVNLTNLPFKQGFFFFSVLLEKITEYMFGSIFFPHFTQN